MGVFSSKQKGVDPLQQSPAVVKRIEDPRSPTEEISRTPIEVAEYRALRDNGLRLKNSDPAMKLRIDFESRLEQARQKENEQPLQ